MGNAVKTVLLLGVLTGLLLAIGDALGGRQGLILALGIAGLMNFVGYFFSDKIALAMHHAQPVDEREAPELYAVVAELAQRAGIPMPRLYVIPELQPNAFATGRSPKHAAVAVTEGLLRTMNRAELAGVLAHELAHVKNRDILTASIAATLAGAITVLARMVGYALMFGGRDREDNGGALGGIFLLIVAPIAALLIQLAISRSREYAADEKAARLTGNPMGLASALRKLAALTERVPMETAQPATASLMIANPLSGGGLMRLFSTHPPIEERIARLEAMVGRL
ncbi:protease HtpX [Thermoanaerobaculum aquaticum]|uniref:Protease HtpX homolog n=1 Tax=Thermoanaerobaculum aquaticum TaxID=1312852 RepID=A0A062XW75_9BACT|nr:zinc metalloprotease HtpX [Thermoanaerobaculum aquaticum]KDA53659.1 protease HtpX [Thermoanaerobaculum aquaticum]